MKDKIKYIIEEAIKENGFISDELLDEIISLSIDDDAYNSNVGIDTKRLNEHNPREVAFYETWRDENYPHKSINFGHGILQDLFIETVSFFPKKDIWNEEINNRDRKIVATVIQWLGTNCGIAFLQKALDKCGYEIVKK